MSDDLVDRVAAAIVGAEGIHWNDTKDWEKEQYRDMARAAFAAQEGQVVGPLNYALGYDEGRKAASDEIERLTAELKEATEIIASQLRGYRTSKDSVRAFAFVDKHSEG